MLYLLTAQRGVSWQDSGMFQWRVLTGDYAGKLGLALAHPLYIAAGRVLLDVPIGSFAARLNFFSGVGTAVALANLAAVGAILTRRRWIGAAVAAMLAVAHTVWWLSTVAEVYTWSAAGLTAELWLLVSLLRRPRRRTLWALALVNGLGLCVHNFALLPLPIYLTVAIVLALRKKLPRWSLTGAAGAYLLGAGFYLGMTIDLAWRTGDVLAAIRSALVGNYAGEVLNTALLWRYLKANAALGALNFVGLLLPLAVVGWIHMRRRLGSTVAAALGGVTVIQIAFVIRYPVPDQFTFLLPTLIMIGLAGAVGLAVLAEKSRRWRNAAVAAVAASVILPPIVYGFAPGLVRSAGWTIERERKLPFRDELRYWIVPWKHDERSAELFASAALRQAHPNGVILVDSTSLHPLQILRRKTGLGEGVTIGGNTLPKYEKETSASFIEALGGRLLFLVSPANAPDALREDRDVDIFRPEGQVLHLVKWKDPPSGRRPANPSG